MKILLVEDDAPLRSALEELLPREGYEVKKAANYREARAGLDSGIDLVMLDVTLPIPRASWSASWPPARRSRLSSPSPPSRIRWAPTAAQCVFPCKDAYGNTFEETMEVTLTVDEPLPELTEEVPEKKKTDPGIIFLGILCVLLIAGLIVQHLVLAGKIHKLEEDRL